ncbi:hypothetical protein [Clostridium sp. BSD9I1]|uniref:hypothetical protein n=1 Tax=Clostridium sp. BSD9I1 TaxID=2003589 RepID=UPI001644634C|nr:hypothetical protein [Clostridium sp. BSD9I1]
MKYTKTDEIIFTYIVNGLIKLSKDPDYIKKFLEDNNLCKKATLKHFHQLTWELLKTEWQAAYGWLEVLNSLSLNHENISYEEEVNIINSDIPSQDKKESLIIIHKNKKIPYIEKFQLNKILLNEDINIEISPNDAATLLKIMGSLQSKLNEVIKSINSIAELINGETRKAPLPTSIENANKNEEIAFSENSAQVILINMEAIQSKFNEIVRTIRSIEHILDSNESNHKY